MAGSFAFDRFVLDTQDRRLSSDGEPVEVNGRYFDALALLVRGHGRLVSKDRFLAEVWRGVPVTDEALTQCIKTLRRELGDDAASPRFIETVPKHGYRFIAPIKVLDTAHDTAAPEHAEAWHRFVTIGASGTLGGAAAGLIGGVVYGFAAAPQSSVGASSVLVVLVWLTLLVALVGAAAVSFAIAVTAFARTNSWQWVTLAGAGGGLVVGAFGKLIGLDALTLLFGHSPADITGAMEGLLVGAAVGAGAFLASRARSIPRGITLATIAGGLAGVVIDLLDGRLMLGSLALLTHNFPSSRLRVDRIGRLFGEEGFGPITQLASTILESALFSGCVVGAMMIAQRRFRRNA